MNKVLLVGRVSSQPVLNSTSTGAYVINFDVETIERWTDKNGKLVQKKQYHPAVQFGKNAVSIDAMIKKFDWVAIDGSLWVSFDEDKDKLVSQVKINTIEVLK